MTLSARIAIDPSRRLQRLATVLPAVGFVVAATTLALRWPQASTVMALVAVAGCLALFGLSRRYRPKPVTLTVSHRRELDLEPDPADSEGPWRLVDTTVIWPGFSMLALRRADPAARARVVRIPVFADELDAAGRRALGRFLIWSLHGGAGPQPVSPGR